MGHLSQFLVTALESRLIPKHKQATLYQQNFSNWKLNSKSIAQCFIHTTDFSTLSMVFQWCLETSCILWLDFWNSKYSINIPVVRNAAFLNETRKVDAISGILHLFTSSAHPSVFSFTSRIHQHQQWDNVWQYGKEHFILYKLYKIAGTVALGWASLSWFKVIF